MDTPLPPDPREPDDSEPLDVDAFLGPEPDTPTDPAVATPVAAPSVRSGTVSHRRNIATTGRITLHDGERMKVEGIATLIYRPDGTPRSISLEIERQERKSKFLPLWTRDAPRIRLVGDEVELLFAYIAEHRRALTELRDVEYLFMPLQGDAGTIDLAGLAGLVKRVTADPLAFRPLAEMVGAQRLRALRAVANLGRFEQGRAELLAMVEADVVEADLQQWFENNDWVFGTEYFYIQRVRQLSAESQIDLLFRSIDGYADIFELKRAGFPVLVKTPGKEQLQPSADLNSAFAQGVRYLAEATDLRLYNSQRRDINLYQPRVRLVIGRSHEWDDEYKRAFRDITAAWHGIEVLTYDMVLARIDLLIRTMATELRTKERAE